PVLRPPSPTRRSSDLAVKSRTPRAVSRWLVDAFALVFGAPESGAERELPLGTMGGVSAFAGAELALSVAASPPGAPRKWAARSRSEEHTSELQSLTNL